LQQYDDCDVYLFLLQVALLASLLVVVVTGQGQKRQRHKIKKQVERRANVIKFCYYSVNFPKQNKVPLVLSTLSFQLTFACHLQTPIQESRFTK
jgi:hypothetical protein